MSYHILVLSNRRVKWLKVSRHILVIYLTRLPVNEAIIIKSKFLIKYQVKSNQTMSKNNKKWDKHSVNITILIQVIDKAFENVINNHIKRYTMSPKYVFNLYMLSLKAKYNAYISMFGHQIIVCYLYKFVFHILKSSKVERRACLSNL